jgi:cation diffusion facilitator family transporter
MGKYDWQDDGYFVTETRDLGKIRRVLILTMLLNFAAMLVKLIPGILSGALSVVADAMDSLFDGLSNVVGLAGLYAAAKPPDAEHPYGHRKFETVAALSIAFLLFLTCWQILQAAWHRLTGEAPTAHVNGVVMAAMVVSMLIQAGTSYYELREGRRLKSELLVADALHTRASILVSFSVLVGLILVRLGFPKADPLLAIFVAVMIAKIGVDVLRETLPVLVDRAVIDPNLIAEVVRSVGGVESFHRVRSRGADGSALVDLHVRISPDKTVQQADAIAAEIRRKLLEKESITDVTVHVEAEHAAGPAAPEIFATLKQTAGELGVVVHESWAHRLDGHLTLEAHIGVSPELTLGQAHELTDKLEWELRKRLPEVRAFHTHIEMATVQVQEGEHVPAAIEQRVQTEVEQVIRGMPALAHPHNIVVEHIEGEGQGYRVFLEAYIDPETPVSEAHALADRLEHELSQRLEGVVDVFVHLEPPEASSKN